MTVSKFRPPIAARRKAALDNLRTRYAEWQREEAEGIDVIEAAGCYLEYMEKRRKRR